ncbi:MAG TPA: hypothetical protein VND19_10375 [Acetobacteraceae bacterium]|nr:hypothetical protein [Acetobacteraceae bacterium]
MPTATVDDVREAVGAAIRHFEAGNAAVAPPLQYFDAYDTGLHPNGVPIIFNTVAMVGPVTARWDYGHPAMYVMEQANILHLQTFATEQELTVLGRVWKPALGCYEINLVKTALPRRFNYHVAVT